MILFIDSDILLDTILIRQPYFSDSTAIVELSDRDHFTLCASVHSLLNIHYAAKKVFGEKSARQSVLVLTRKLKIVAEDINIVIESANSDFPDFEDAVQYYAAVSANADVIITRNLKDYKKSTLQVLTPEQFLRTL